MLRLSDVTLSVGGHELLVGVDWHVRPGDRIGLVGRNGAGKSTLLRAIGGEIPLDAGTITLRGDARIGYLPQQAVSGSVLPLWDEVASGMVHHRRLAAELRQAQDAVERREPGAVIRLGEAEEQFRLAGGYAAEERIGGVLHGLGFRPEDWPRTCDTFSGGWQMRIALARLLLSDANVLLLDEPTNHLDLLARSWLVGFLEKSEQAIVLVSHDRHVLDTVVQRITEVTQNSLVTYTGNLSAWLAERELRRKQQQTAFEHQQDEIARLERFIDRFKATATKAAAARSRMKRLEKMERLEAPERDVEPRYVLPEPPESAYDTLVLRGATFGWTSEPVLEDVDLSLTRGMRIAVLGANGCGKSTLLHALAGRLALHNGRRIVGDRVRMGVFTQDLAQDLPGDETGLAYLSTLAPTAELSKVWASLGALGLGGEKAKQSIASLSGGEKARVALAAFSLKAHNVLLLDEPTNHLDAVAVGVLAKALVAFEGTLLFVSHDRWLVEQVATHVLRIEEGELHLHEGVMAEDFQLASRPSSRQAAGPTAGGEAFAEKKRRDREQERAKRRIETIGVEVESLEAQIEKIDSELYEVADYKRAAALGEQRDALQRQVNGLFEEWEQLEAEGG